jgi:NmrA-like family
VGFVAGSSIQLKIAQTVLDAGVARYFPWQFGVDYDVIGRGSAQDLFDVQLDVRDLLRAQSKTEWVIVSTGMFMTFLFEKFFGVIDLDESIVRALGSWNTAVTVTTPEDIGALTAEIVFMTNPRFRNEVVFTAGDTVTYGRLAHIVESVLGRKVRREKWSVKFLKNKLAKDPENPIKKYRVVFAEGRGVSWEVEKSFNWKNGKEVANVEWWARENLRS